jgi:hypothetical protein
MAWPGNIMIATELVNTDTHLLADRIYLTQLTNGLHPYHITLPKMSMSIFIHTTNTNAIPVLAFDLQLSLHLAKHP